MVSWQVFPSLPPSSRAPRISLAPKTPFPCPFKRLQRRLGHYFNLGLAANSGSPWILQAPNLHFRDAVVNICSSLSDEADKIKPLNTERA